MTPTQTQVETSNQEQWTAVDHYLTDLLLPSDPALEAALEASAAAGLPSIQVSPTQGKLLHLLAMSLGARKILELGTLGGYSTIWMARALPAGGRLITLEADAKHAEVARANIARAGLANVVDLRLGRAQETLPKLADEAPFDPIFIDADKMGYPEYFQWAMKLTRRGSGDANVQGARRFYEMVAREPRVSATAIQTVGSKGYDGFAMAVVTG
ncbi:MAG: methyltransferase [Acidobacteria bacterium]|nr:MAG: methyltransferase [Acidobacteriota bacterium]